MNSLSKQARYFIVANVLLGLGAFALGVVQWQWTDTYRFVLYVIFAALASTLKVCLPGVTGTMSVVFLFVLIGNTELGLLQNMVIGCGATIVQCFWNARNGRPKPVQLAFNVCSWAYAVTASYIVYHSLIKVFPHSMPFVLAGSATVFFVANTIPVATIISLTEKRKPIRSVWAECYFWSFPYYLIGAGIAAAITVLNEKVGWQTTFLVLPVIYLIHRSYRLYLARLEDEKTHVEQMASLHMRTIEALALAIEAKDHSTHDHLNRVRFYAVALGEELGISGTELEALKAAALLHDIGKLAVPEHIINKPGKLTAEEFQKMKIHPMIGAEILERVSFPYPVVPIVRAHHEKWNGKGYPDGLKGEEIPLGARVLAVADCFDALISDRQYRRALTLEAAMEVIIAESGISYDPRVVELLKSRYVELERRIAGMDARTEAKVQPVRVNTAIPLRGLDMEPSGEMKFLDSIAAARQEGHMLFELSHDLGNSLSLDETLSVLCLRLKKLVPYDSATIFVTRCGKLVAEHASGDNFRLLANLTIPVGEGISGWVAQNRKPIVNGDPTLDLSFSNEFSQATVRSTLSIPLEGINGVVGVMTMYSNRAEGFTADHVRVLLAISSKIAFSVENALKYRLAEDSATTDYLTGLPNARSLFLQLDQELERCKRSVDAPLTVLVCDLDGFKQVNDRYGHLEGNRVLQTFAHKLKTGCRKYDYVARMGGDEFVIVAPGLHPEDVDEATARLERFAQEAGREVCKTDILSLSLGHAHYPADGTDAERLLAEADRRMYLVKQQHHSVPRHSMISQSTSLKRIN